MNIRGILEQQHGGTEMGYLMDFLNVYGPRDWMKKYATIEGGAYMDSLRRLLRDMGTTSWIEITSGLSYLAFKALDVYIGIESYGRVPAQRAWYLANASGPPLDRGIPHAEDWYYYTDLLSIGQREAPEEWTVDPLSCIPQQARIALRRVDRILGHLPMTDLGVMIGALGSLPDGQNPVLLLLAQRRAQRYEIEGKGNGEGKGKDPMWYLEKYLAKSRW